MIFWGFNKRSGFSWRWNIIPAFLVMLWSDHDSRVTLMMGGGPGNPVLVKCIRVEVSIAAEAVWSVSNVLAGSSWVHSFLFLSIVIPCLAHLPACHSHHFLLPAILLGPPLIPPIPLFRFQLPCTDHLMVHILKLLMALHCASIPKWPSRVSGCV